MFVLSSALEGVLQRARPEKVIKEERMERPGRMELSWLSSQIAQLSVTGR